MHSYEAFKPACLRSLSNVMKTAAWAIPTKQTRISFEGLLETLFRARENLRTAIEETFASANMETAVVSHGVTFNRDVMDDASLFSTGLDQNTEDDEVVGTVGIGLMKVEDKVKAGSAHKNFVLRPQVVLESALQAALRGESQTKGQVPTNVFANNTDGRE